MIRIPGVVILILAVALAGTKRTFAIAIAIAIAVGAFAVTSAILILILILILHGTFAILLASLGAIGQRYDRCIVAVAITGILLVGVSAFFAQHLGQLNDLESQKNTYLKL